MRDLRGMGEDLHQIFFWILWFLDLASCFHTHGFFDKDVEFLSVLFNLFHRWHFTRMLWNETEWLRAGRGRQLQSINMFIMLCRISSRQITHTTITDSVAIKQITHILFLFSDWYQAKLLSVGKRKKLFLRIKLHSGETQSNIISSTFYLFFFFFLKVFKWTFSHLYFSSLFLLQLTAAIVFLSFGIIFSFLCLVIDGACIVLNMVSYLLLHVYTVTLDMIAPCGWWNKAAIEDCEAIIDHCAGSLWSTWKAIWPAVTLSAILTQLCPWKIPTS